MLPNIFAHRDVGNTSCPGNAGYAKMGQIRDIAAAYAKGGGGSPAPSKGRGGKRGGRASTRGSKAIASPPPARRTGRTTRASGPVQEEGAPRRSMRLSQTSPNKVVKSQRRA